VAALDELERIAGSRNEAEVSVVRNDADAAGELAEQAAAKIAAACRILGSRLRAREPGYLAAMTRDAANGYRARRRREAQAPTGPARGRHWRWPAAAGAVAHGRPSAGHASDRCVDHRARPTVT